MAPKRKRVAKKPVVQKQKQKQSQNVSQRVTVNLVPAKPKAPRKRAIANSNYKAYQQPPQTIFLNNPAPVFPTQQNQGFSPVQASQPLGVRVMEPASQFSPPERIEAPVPSPIEIRTNPLRDTSIFGEESPIISRLKPPVKTPTPVINENNPFSVLSNDDSMQATRGDISELSSINSSLEQPPPQPRRLFPPSMNKMNKNDLIKVAEKYDLPTTRSNAKGKPVKLSKDDLKSSIGIYLSNRLTL